MNWLTLPARMGLAAFEAAVGVALDEVFGVAEPFDYVSTTTPPPPPPGETDEAIGWLREWGAAGFPRRCDGSVPLDYLIAMRRLTGVTVERMPTLCFEAALTGGHNR